MSTMKRIVLAVAMGTLALPAAMAAKGRSAKKRPKGAAVTDIAALKISTGTPRNMTELLAHFQEIDKNIQSLSARFEQSITMSEAGIFQQVEGSLEYLKPNRLRLEQRKPERQTIVSDGDTIWSYNVAKNQAISSSLADWKKSDLLVGNLMDFGNYTRL